MESEHRVAEALALARTIYERAVTGETARERRIGTERGRMVADADGKATLAALMDRAFRSKNPGVTAQQFSTILRRRGIPKFFSPFERAGLAAFEFGAAAFPALFVPFVKTVMRKKTADVILPGEPRRLLSHVVRRQREGVRLNLNHLGEMILGEAEADQKTADDVALLENPAVDCISVKASNLYSQIAAIAHDHGVRKMIERLRPRLAAAKANRTKKGGYKLVNLDMEEYRDLRVTVDAFIGALDDPQFLDLQAGIALQAYVPESYAIAERLLAWAKTRVERGGAPIRVRVVKGANRAMELVDSSVRGLASPTYDEKIDTDANWKTIVELISRPENIRVCHLGIASHNIFDLAWAAALIRRREVGANCVFEMLEGMANHVQREVRHELGDVLLYAPAVPAKKFLTAIAYLMRRFDELTDPNNFLSHMFGVQPGSAEWERLASAFVASVERMRDVPHERRRTQNRATERYAPHVIARLEDFRNEPDTDWTAAENRAWLQERVIDRFHRAGPVTMAAIAGCPPSRDLKTVARGVTPCGRLRVDVYDRSFTNVLVGRIELATQEDAENALAAAVADRAWSDLPSKKRDAILAEAVCELQRGRAELIALAAANVGKTFDQSDAEISEAIDFGRLYPFAVRHLRESCPDLEMKPLGIVMVISPWNFPIAIPAGGIFAALAAGNRVILKPSRESMLVSTKIADCLWAAGVPRTALQVLNCDNAVAAKLAADDRIAAVIFTGSTATADKLLAGKPDLCLFAETGGKNATIITANADRELAIKHVVDSFRNNGQKCSATSLVLATPDVYDDAEFWSQLTDAAASLPVGPAWDPHSVITPLFRAPGPALLRGLTELEDGEEWVRQPRKVDGRDDFWTPGIKKGTRRGGFTHMTELFGPVIAVMRVEDLDEALDVIRETGRGLTLGVETLDDDELRFVTERAPVGVIYARRGTVGAIANRQTFGGWANSRRGPGIHAGSVNYVTNVMEIRDKNGADIAAAIRDYATQWKEYFSKEHRPAQDVRGEDNVHRFRPLGDVVIRVTAEDSPFETACRIAAATIAGNAVTMSDWRRESDDALAERIERGGIAMVRYADPKRVPGRIFDAVARHPATYVCHAPVVAAGRIELLRYLQEQTVSDVYHRYGGNLRPKDLLY